MVYQRESEDVKSSVRLARQDEWENWRKVNAPVPINFVELQNLFDEGYRMVRTQWIEFDKNEHLRGPGGPPVAPQYKGRLVVRGDLEVGHPRGFTNVRTAGTQKTLKRADITS
eukprot:8067884-Pyramimonas_sp.AAC.1